MDLASDFPSPLPFRFRPSAPQRGGDLTPLSALFAEALRKALDLRTGSHVYTEIVNKSTTLSSGELAARTGISVDTLRHYEQKGVLPAPPRRGSYREYPAEAVGMVQTIRRALSIGFTLDELARVLSMRSAGKPPCRTVMAMAEAKRKQLEQRIDELVALRDELQQIIGEWQRRLEKTPEGKMAGLLDSLSDRRPIEKDKEAFRRTQ
jgi:DNA-binding transcriptional MerR regulator